MTRRIIIAILASVWVMMLVAGVATYAVARSVLLHELDGRLLARAAALPEVSGRAGTTPDAADRYLIRGEHGQTLRRVEPVAADVRPKVISATFARLGDGVPYRSLTIQFDPVTASSSASPASPVTVIYSGSAEVFERGMRNLAWALGGLGLLGGTAAAGVAAAVSRATLRPLKDVADTVGAIDENNLGRRVDTNRLPDEMRLMGERLNGMLARIERYFQQRRQFLADASHELRTPVAAMVNMIEVTLASRNADAARTRRTLDNCLVDARVLRDLVNKLTTQVRSELPRESEAWQDVDVVRLFADCVTVAEGLAVAKGVRVAAELPDRLVLHTQPDRLRRVCLNLLSNGVSYNTPGGRLLLQCEANGDDVHIAVSDTGIGIAQEHLPHVFTPFFRVDASRERSDGHLGLGMSQVQTDVSALGGAVRIESELNVGTTIRVTLKSAVREHVAREQIHANSNVLPK